MKAVAFSFFLFSPSIFIDLKSGKVKIEKIETLSDRGIILYKMVYNTAQKTFIGI